MSGLVNLLLAYSTPAKHLQAAGKGLDPHVPHGQELWPSPAAPGAAWTRGRKVALPKGACDLVVRLPRQVQNHEHQVRLGEKQRNSCLSGLDGQD